MVGEPLHGGKAGEFYRIHLYREQMDRGEESAFRAEIYQPEVVLQRKCRSCGRRMKRQDEWHFHCQHAECKLWGRMVNVKPKRGVMKILTPKFDGTRVNEHVLDGVKHYDSIVLVMDRRYDRSTLDTIHRTAGGLADILGLKIK